MIVLIWIVILILALVLYNRQVFSRFSKHGVKCVQPLPLLGNLGRVLLRKDHICDQFDHLYHSFPEERFVGRYDFTRPLVFLRDVELIKKITIKDFEYFLDHRVLVDENMDPLFGRNLLSLKVDYADVDCMDLTTRHANDVIATCAFGLKVDSHTDVDNKFYALGKETGTFDFRRILAFLGYTAFPRLMKLLGMKLFSDSISNFFRSIILDAMKERESKNILRPDMIHLLMEAKKGKLTYDEKPKEANAGFATVEESHVGQAKVNREWSDTDLVAQALLFFIAGFDTVSTALSFLLYELACNPDIQDRLVQGIKEHNAKHDDKFNFNSIQNMPYLDMVVSELLRRWTPAIGLDRLCAKDYNLGKPNSNYEKDYIIRKGEAVIIPVWSIHHDAEFYPDPFKFDPERFSEENKKNIKPFTYLPFGFGPRNCIGSRFALCEIKVLVYQLLQQIEVSPCEKTQIPAVLSPESFNLRIKGGNWLRFRTRQ